MKGPCSVIFTSFLSLLALALWNRRRPISLFTSVASLTSVALFASFRCTFSHLLDHLSLSKLSHLFLLQHPPPLCILLVLLLMMIQIVTTGFSDDSPNHMIAYPFSLIYVTETDSDVEEEFHGLEKVMGGSANLHNNNQEQNDDHHPTYYKLPSAEISEPVEEEDDVINASISHIFLHPAHLERPDDTDHILDSEFDMLSEDDQQSIEELHRRVEDYILKVRKSFWAESNQELQSQ